MAPGRFYLGIRKFRENATLAGGVPPDGPLDFGRPPRSKNASSITGLMTLEKKRCKSRMRSSPSAKRPLPNGRLYVGGDCRILWVARDIWSPGAYFPDCYRRKEIRQKRNRWPNPADQPKTPPCTPGPGDPADCLGRKEFMSDPEKSFSTHPGQGRGNFGWPARRCGLGECHRQYISIPWNDRFRVIFTGYCGINLLSIVSLFLIGQQRVTIIGKFVKSEGGSSAFLTILRKLFREILKRKPSGRREHLKSTTKRDGFGPVTRLAWLKTCLMRPCEWLALQKCQPIEWRRIWITRRTRRDKSSPDRNDLPAIDPVEYQVSTDLRLSQCFALRYLTRDSRNKKWEFVKRKEPIYSPLFKLYIRLNRRFFGLIKFTIAQRKELGWPYS